MKGKKKQPQAATFILVILLIAGAGALYWVFFLKPMLLKIGDLREANMVEEQAIAAIEAKLAQEEEILQKWELASEKESYLLSKVPAAADLPRVLGALEGMVRSAALDLEALTAGEFQDAERYRFIPVTLRVKGAVKEILVLMEKIEQFTHMTLSKQVRLEELKEGDYQLDFYFDLVFIIEGQDNAMGIEQQDQDQDQDQV